MVPTLTGITLSDSNTVAGTLVPGNNFIQIISNIKVAFSGAAGTYESTVTGFRAEIVGKNASTTANGGTLGAMNWTGSATVRAYVTDSRGRQSAARDVTIDVLPYHPPVLSFDVSRVGTTSSTLQIRRRAKIAPLKVDNVQKNVLTLTFKVAEVGTTTYTPDNGSANASLTTQWELVNSLANLAGTYIGSKSYVVIGTLSDKFSTVEFKAEIATESVVMSYSRNGVGIGKIWERGSLDVAGPIYSGNKLIQHHQLTTDNGRAFFHGANFNCNNYLINGQVACNQPLNGPAVGTGPNEFFVDIIGESDNYLMQRAVQKETARTFVRTRHGGTWTPWVETALTNHTNLINTGWQSMGYPGSYYKRVGDVLTIKYNFTGNGGAINFGNVPASVWVAPQSLMLVIAMWSIAGNDNTHVQVDSGTGVFIALATRSGNNYVGMLTIMI